MREWAATLLVAVLLALAGCSISMGQDGPHIEPSGDPAWTGDEDNPYRQETLAVAVAVSPDTSREFTPLVREALAYWEANSEQYAGYPIDYRLVANASNPDLRVRFVESVGECGTETHAAGCAPIVETHGQFDPPMTVRVRTGFSDASTVQVLKHELGHTLGLDHGDAPRSVMNAESTLTTPPQTNASERALPWKSATLSVYVDVSALPRGERDEARRQIRHALEYFDAGASGTVPENVSFVRTNNETAADVTVRAVDELACGTSSGSCGYILGLDPDGDGAREWHTRLEITVSDLDTEAIAWHVGRWLGAGFGLEGDEYPEPLRESATYKERRSDWWD
ncbi:MAG: matrixin family metalloprotease [Haloglomus sp.]